MHVDQAEAAAEDCKQRQEDELLAMLAIYPNLRQAELLDSSSAYSLHIPDDDSSFALEFKFLLPEAYPLESPFFQLRCDRVPADIISGLAWELQASFEPGARMTSTVRAPIHRRSITHCPIPHPASN